jgi:hypothetical protein
MQIESFRAATLWVISVDFRLSAICRALVMGEDRETLERWGVWSGAVACYEYWRSNFVR